VRRRGWLTRRAAVSEEPIRWKERHVEGIAPLAALRQIPRWLGMLLIFAATVSSSILILWLNAAGAISLTTLRSWATTGNLVEMWTTFAAAGRGLVIQGNVALLLATFIVAIRCSGAVTGERERQTWEALLLTPLAVRQFIRGKLWGIIGASYPYLFAYFVPAFVLCLLAGIGPAVVITFLLGATWLAMLFVGASGLWCSVRSKSSWRALLSTLGITYVGGFVLFVVSLPLIGIMYLLIYLTLYLLDQAFQTGISGAFAASGGTFMLGSYLVLLGIFGALTYYFINDAEKYVADRERVRHWDEERSYRPRPTRARRSVSATPTR
jgi:hypothetical protein